MSYRIDNEKEVSLCFKCALIDHIREVFEIYTFACHEIACNLSYLRGPTIYIDMFKAEQYLVIEKGNYIQTSQIVLPARDIMNVKYTRSAYTIHDLFCLALFLFYKHLFWKV